MHFFNQKQGGRRRFILSLLALLLLRSGAFCRRPSSDIKVEAAAALPLVSSPQETKEDTKNASGELHSHPLPL